MAKPGEAHDKNGIPIYPGDVLRTFHFRHYRHRRKMYLYHVARLRSDGHMEAVPAGSIGTAVDGGTFNLLEGNACEIVQSSHNEAEDFINRPKKGVER